ncbi:hypothetical protein FACS189491_02820 [Spirochaetia bacterium]|nr:hypothetical protein FACS189491_02820 [Spirochaetia bacterium]
MSKKTNTWLFILGATVFNILITIISFLVLFFIYAKFIMGLLPGDTFFAVFFVVSFIASIALSFIIYRVILKYLLKRFDVEKYFDPIFGRRGPNKINRD